MPINCSLSIALIERSDNLARIVLFVLQPYHIRPFLVDLDEHLLIRDHLSALESIASEWHILDESNVQFLNKF